MQRIGIGIALLGASPSCAKDSSDLKPPSSNILNAQCPRVDNTLRVQMRFKAPEAMKVRGNRWSGLKVDMEKQPECARRLAEISEAIDCLAVREQSYGCLTRKVSGPLHHSSIADSVNRIRVEGQTR
jgi:hypothetical protein